MMNNIPEAATRLKIIRKRNLNAEQLRHLDDRLKDPANDHDKGPPSVWDLEGYQPNLFAVVLLATDDPIGALYRAGLPNAIDAAWWIDSEYRGKGYGSELIDLLALLLKSEGVTGIGGIRVDTHKGEYDLASRRLVSRLRSYFPPEE